MARYDPIKVAHIVYNPANGVDESLSPVIFLHGLTGSKDMWDDIPQKIADRTKRKIYAIDARNHGDSAFTETFNFDMNVDDLLHFMDTMSIKKAVLLGHSMGGLTATNTALRKPDRVEAVFSEDMFTKKIPQEILNPIINLFSTWTQAIQKIPSELNEEEALKFFVDLMLSNVPKEHEQFVRKQQMYQMKNYLKRGSDGKYDVRFNKSVIYQAIQNAETLVSDPSGQFSGPAYFLYGGLSPMQVDKEEDNIRKLFPKAELIAFKEATHNVHGDCPEKYVDIVVERLLQLN